jgi:2-polyprenyl-3-methyl-5-hydroxy-6-metoxy-1,4-benzoquinol methylase
MCAHPVPADATFFTVSAGERTVPGVWHENYWLRRHEVVYRHVADMASIETLVLDAGCGEGYGTAILAERASRVLALDYDSCTAQHLAEAYPSLSAVRANLVALPLRDSSLDLLVSLQTIEHLWSPEAFVAECARVLRPGGRLALSTPNRLTFPPGNVFHHRELDAWELAALLATSFDDVAVSGVHHGERLRQWEARHGSIVDAQIAEPPDAWDATLAAMVREVGAHDFIIGADTSQCLDLLAAGSAP